MDVKRLMRTTNRPRTYIYYDGRLHIIGIPRPFMKVIDLGVEAVPEVAEAAPPEEVEEAEEEEIPRTLRVEEEEASEPVSEEVVGDASLARETVYKSIAPEEPIGLRPPGSGEGRCLGPL